MLIKNILVGEDIRHEVGNKISLMGIFGNSINIGIPADAPKDIKVGISLAVLLTIENSEDQQSGSSFTIDISVLTSGNTVATLKAQIQASADDRIIHVPFPKFNIVNTKSSEVTISARIVENNTLISEKSIKLNVNITRA